MGLFDRLFGTDDNNQQPQRQAARTDDEIAVERYRYLLRTAPPETIEQVHAEAFSKLTQEQRDLLFAQLSEDASDAPRDTSPAALASSATRQELRNPGTMERSFNGGNSGGGMGFGGTFASSLLGTVAGYVIASTLVSAFLPNDFGGDTSGDNADSGADSADSGADSSADSGGDFGGGDFGGGDFGGGFDF